MPNPTAHKMKPLYLMRTLMEQTDEEHPLTIKDLIGELDRHGIVAERKSVYDDLERLTLYGVPIEKHRSNTVSYCVAEREFELAELRVLIDAVQSSRAIPPKKSTRLIRKLSSLASVHQGKRLRGDTLKVHQSKPMNETVLYTVDAIHTAISQSRKISFRYFDYGIQKERVFRKDGEAYIRTPVSLVYNEDCYYLIAYSAKYDGLAHFRVDRMLDVTVLDEVADKTDIDIGAYCKTLFGMYHGETILESFIFDPTLVNAIIDRFGSGVSLREEAEGLIGCTAEVAVSPAFLGWLVQFGKRIRVKSPQSLVDKTREYLLEILGAYEDVS